MKRRLLLSSAVALAFLAPASSSAQRNVDLVQVDALAEKMGLKLGPSTAHELELGQSTTMLLTKPEKLAIHGIKMHEGARVTVTCVGPGRLRIEADELQPVPKTVVVMLKLGDGGTLEPAPDRTATTGTKPR